MPKATIVLTVILFSSAFAGEVYHFTGIAEPAISTDGNISSDKRFIMQEPGKPRLPYECYRLVLPYGESITDVDAKLECLVRIDGRFDIPFAQSPQPMSAQATVVDRDAEVYANDKPYPYVEFRLQGVDRLCGVDIATVKVFPYKYNPVTQELSYYSRVTISMKTLPDEIVRTQQSRKICRSDAAQSRLERLTVNPEMIETYPSRNEYSATRELIDPGEPCEFLIVAGQAYADLFNSYAEWKETHGVTAAVYTIEDILTEYVSGVDGPENLRDFIIDAYQTWAGSDHPLEYVLLAGDDEIIPIRGCWGHTYYFGTDYYVPCDLYYGCLDGDWNANGNSYYGEVDDNPDLFAEVHVGRFPGDNQQDFENMIYKTQQYVDDPWPDVYTALMIGEKLSDDPLAWGGDYLDLICDDPQYTPTDYDVTKMYQRDGTFSTYAVTEHVNSNQSALIYHCAHTHYYYLLGWSQSDIDNLQNTEYPFFSAGGCFTLAFDQATSGYSEAVGEHALSAEGAMMAFLGNSRYGFSNWTNFIQQLMAGIFTEDLKTIGAGLTYSRDQLAQYIGDDPVGEIWRWEYYELNLAGDPQVHLVENCSDGDHDGDCDSADNCAQEFNPLQEDSDGDLVGDSCDNCIHAWNPDQEDSDEDGIGDSCDVMCGDVDASGGVDIDDVVYLVDFIFAGGPEPVIYESGDVECSGGVDIDDAVYLITFIFSSGPEPCICDQPARRMITRSVSIE